MTIREQIMQALMAALSPWPGTVYRSRRDAIFAREMPAVAIYPVDEEVEEQMSARSRRLLHVVVEIIDRGSEADQDPLNPEGFPPDHVADETVSEIHRLILADQELGGLVEYVDEGGTEWGIVAADNDIASVRMGFSVSYITQIKNLELAA